MKTHTILIVAGLLAMNGVCDAQAQVPAYFEKLQSEKVLSEPHVSWTQFGPGSAGYCEIVEYHPTHDNCVIMSPDMYNNYGSWDNGSTWQTLNDCDGTSLGPRRLRDITFSMQDPDYGLAVDERGWLWVTHDMGHHWKREYSFPANGVCSVITFDPTDDQIIYAGGGNFWNVKWNNRTFASPRHRKATLTAFDNIICDFNHTLQQIHQDLRDPDNPCQFDPLRYARTCYSRVSRTEYGKIWRSTNGGSDWQLINDGIPEDADIGKILFHPSDSTILYMCTSHGLYKSETRGERWTNIGTNLPHNMPRDLAVHFDEKIGKPALTVIDQVFWEGDQKGGTVSTGGVFRSVDEGASWQSLNGNLYLDLTGMGPYVRNSYYKALARWFGVSVQKAKKEYPKLPKKALQNFNRLLLDPSNPERMYVGHNAFHDISFHAGDLWKTEDGGERWIVCNRVGPDWQGVDKKFWQQRGNPTNTNMRFAHLQRQVNERPYGGKTGCRALAINSRGDVITVMEQQTLRSKDHGESWQQVDAVEASPGSGCWIGTGCSNLTRPRYYMDARMPGRYLLLCGEHGLWQMCDEGDSALAEIPAVKQIVGQAHETHDPTSISTVAVHPKDTNIMYMQMYRQAHAGFVRRTTDGGKTWENISRPIRFSISVATGRVTSNSLIIDRDSPDHMYFCVPSWDKFTEMKQTPGFRDFGVYHSADGGRNWERVNSGLPGEANVTKLCFDPDDPKVLYAALCKSTDLVTDGGLYRTEDRGVSWKALPVPAEIESVNDVFIDGRNSKIYIACGLSFGAPESGGVWVSGDRGQTWKKIFHMPLVFQVTVAPYDSDRIAVSVGENTRINNLNSGAYLSYDGGAAWHKSNRGLGQPYWIVDLKFDLVDPDILWCGLLGSGWYRGVIEN